MSDPTSSTVPAIKQQLVTLMQASPLLGQATPPIQVTYNAKAADAVEREVLYFVGTEITEGFAAVRAGRKKRDETYTLRLQIRACKPAQAGDEAEARAFVLLSAVEDIIANDPQLGLQNSTTPVDKCEIVRAVAGVDPQGTGWDGLITVWIEVRARLV